MINRYVRNLLALNSHVRFPESERVDIIGLEVRQTVVHEAMCALVAPHSVDHIEELSGRFQPPVVLCDLWRRQVMPVIRWSARAQFGVEQLRTIPADGPPPSPGYTACLGKTKLACHSREASERTDALCNHSLLLEMPDEAVACARREHVAED